MIIKIVSLFSFETKILNLMLNRLTGTNQMKFVLISDSMTTKQNSSPYFGRTLSPNSITDKENHVKSSRMSQMPHRFNSNVPMFYDTGSINTPPMFASDSVEYPIVVQSDIASSNMQNGSKRYLLD